MYGTLCVKCPVGDPDQAAEECVARVVEEIAVVQPRIVVVMGERALATLNDLAAAACDAGSSPGWERCSG